MSYVDSGKSTLMADGYQFIVTKVDDEGTVKPPLHGKGWFLIDWKDSECLWARKGAFTMQETQLRAELQGRIEELDRSSGNR